MVEEVANANGGPTTFWKVPGSEHGISDGGIPEQGLRTYHDQIDAFLVGTPCGIEERSPSD